MTPRRNDPVGTREKILDAAFAAFARQGYNATALLDVREAADVSGGAFSHHYPTKQALGLAVISTRVAEAVEKAWIAPVAEAPDLMTGVASAFEAVVSELRGQGAVHGCPLNNLALEIGRQDEAMRVALAGLFARWRSVVAGRLSRDIAAGAAHGIDPEDAAALIVSAISGAVTLAKSAQDAEPLERCARALKAILSPHYRQD